ncbi:Oxoglutarate and iron-dependent oxygenase degradation C-term-domain-containing protein [Mycena haematopus]|nr:Oxoglutarate and iron-dependent oxygenase degradation C-term-domain-containing protein [Mycena haematopus]
MARTHRRSPSSDRIDSSTLIKKLKSSHVSPPLGAAANGHANGAAPDPTPHFADGVLNHTSIAQLHGGYVSNEPFKYAIVEKLFQDDLLHKVKDECMSELNFTEKETDIYKVNQTGDLASLNYLSSDQISLLPNLLTLRDALYSPVFRNFLRAVTGCGPLSGTKQDMSVNSYTRGCHLLNHDDVIGSRRVSYILYMPLPHFQYWQKDWGGALELYPTIVGPDGEREPVCIPSKSIPPSWNQFIFFEVQPGQSFHSVEEVVVGGGGEDGRARLSISGWFHAAQEGEEGYVAEPVQAQPKSSREQLTMTSTEFKNYPKNYPTETDGPPEETLSDEHTAFLSEFLNPVYLQPRTMKALAARFVEESSLELHSFLSNDLASALEPRLRELDLKDGLGEDRAGRVPLHTSGTGGAWTVRGPPHKWRYCVLASPVTHAQAVAVAPRAAASCDEIVRGLQDELFPSPAFRAWLAIVSRLLPMRHCVEARRFRPGLDYTLATSEEKEARLDVVLGLTPDVRHEEEHLPKGKISRRAEVKPRGWQAAEWGGWECYMAPHNEEDDPAVYRAGTIKKSAKEAKPDANGASSSKSSNGKTNGNGHVPEDDIEVDGEEDGDGDGDGDSSMGVDEEVEEEEEDSTLLTVQPGFNRLLLVLRDERVMRFVKYVSASAEGSRWDVCGEYEVGMMEEEDGKTYEGDS